MTCGKTQRRFQFLSLSVAPLSLLCSCRSQHLRPGVSVALERLETYRAAPMVSPGRQCLRQPGNLPTLAAILPFCHLTF